MKIIRPSYLYNGSLKTGNMTYLYYDNLPEPNSSGLSMFVSPGNAMKKVSVNTTFPNKNSCKSKASCCCPVYIVMDIAFAQRHWSCFTQNSDSKVIGYLEQKKSLWIEILIRFMCPLYSAIPLDKPATTDEETVNWGSGASTQAVSAFCSSLLLALLQNRQQDEGYLGP